MIEDPLQELDLIAQTLFDKKGFNILAIDVREISTLTDYYVIAEGNVDKHVTALGKAVIKRLKDEGDQPAHVEGLESGDWVVIDYIGVVVHLFKPGMREKYRLEELWHEGKVVDLEIEVSHETR
ncbi:MAG: ribosome silencing factor [Chlamydiales bacterium]|nr:ribosome silencing factor [Chlamydiales bacterium]